MQKLACEMCGSTNIIKEDGLYVCQSCGTKYSPEEAKKMMSEGVVDVKGVVKVDTSSDIENLRKLLKRSKQNEQWREVAYYSTKILEKNPDDWEAIFNKELGEAWICSYDNQLMEFKGIITGSKSVIKVLGSKNNLNQIKLSMAEDINYLCSNKYKSALNSFNDTQTLNTTKQYVGTLKNCKMLSNYGISLINPGSDIELYIYQNYVLYNAELTKNRKYNTSGSNYQIYRMDKQTKDNALSEYNKYVPKVKALQPNYQPPKVKNNNGCYIATSVYGSYDCPEVWTLRRYRDNKLNKTIFGKLFIKIYYMTSPTLVKWFGDKKWFNNLFKNRLDKKVEKLQEEGFESTFYIDN